ncbi:MAG: hypothetical protein ACRCXH_12685 [Shewanella sp.]
MYGLQYSLLFTLTPKKSNSLIAGSLRLLQGQTELNAYSTTSSFPGRQYNKSWELKGGLIPPGDFYTVDTTPIWMPNIKGVEGSFYAIAPFEVKTPGAVRGDFGVHFDANAPGSLGCIVLSTQRGWDAVRRDFKAIAEQGISRIPLSVKYG